MPSITRPHTVYWRSRKLASSKQMKNWLSAELGDCARAMDTAPRVCGSLLNSALSFWPEPPMPVPVGSPVWAMKPSMTRWNDHAVVEALARELLDAGDVVRREIGPHLNGHAPLGGLDDERVFWFCHGSDPCCGARAYFSIVAFLM